ncbi:uncharacterized protein BX664DRAFT_329942 [Halteromyces radiatus]|uniref:uncharacterized protein n=1 Tax=Halteromyces radiatus TaxID=101107 RepID=UPI00221F2298|nr:uncharacterized protein BX664DRAFT_329942 [Halteromyces radiatus]KAI8093542.1 hypothetical protein BX664DRAFT_329942 [Halteromyces radiatus]
MEVLNFLSRVKDTFTTQEFASLLQQLSTERFSVPISQVSIPLRAAFRSPSRIHLKPEFDSMINKALTDPVYESMVTRVAEQFHLLCMVQAQFPRSEFAHFVDCFQFDQPNTTDDQIRQRLDQLRQRISPRLRERLDRILNRPWVDQVDTMMENDGMDDDMVEPPVPTTPVLHPQPSPSSEEEAAWNALLQQAYNALTNDPHLCQQLDDILNMDKLNDNPFSTTITNIYEWIQNTNPALWEPLSTVLEQMQTVQEAESSQYESYEDFVQRNFLDGGGQEYLDGEIEQARVQHLFSNLSM